MRKIFLVLVLATSGCYIDTIVNKVSVPSRGYLMVSSCDLMAGSFGSVYTTNCRTELLDLRSGPLSKSIDDD